MGAAFPLRLVAVYSTAATCDPSSDDHKFFTQLFQMCRGGGGAEGPAGGQRGGHRQKRDGKVESDEEKAGFTGTISTVLLPRTHVFISKETDPAR